MGSQPTGDASAYPSKDELLDRHRQYHARITEALPGVDPAIFAQEHPSAEARSFFPTLGDQLVYMLTAMGMKGVLG